MMYQYVSPGNLAKMYTTILNKYCKCEQHKGTFYYMRWTCNTAKNFGIHTCLPMQKILKINIQIKPEVFLLGLMVRQP